MSSARVKKQLRNEAFQSLLKETCLRRTRIYHAANKRTSKNAIAAQIRNKLHNSFLNKSRDQLWGKTCPDIELNDEVCNREIFYNPKFLLKTVSIFLIVQTKTVVVVEIR